MFFSLSKPVGPKIVESEAAPRRGVTLSWRDAALRVPSCGERFIPSKRPAPSLAHSEHVPQPEHGHGCVQWRGDSWPRLGPAACPSSCTNQYDTAPCLEVGAPRSFLTKTKSFSRFPAGHGVRHWAPNLDPNSVLLAKVLTFLKTEKSDWIPLELAPDQVFSSESPPPHCHRVATTAETHTKWQRPARPRGSHY